MRRWLAVLPLAALAALGVLFAVYALHRNPHVDPQATVGKPIPALTLPDLEQGRPVALAGLAAQGPVLINFYASWCAPCEIEHPVLRGLTAQQVRIVGVAYKDAPENSRAFLTRLGDPFVQRLVDRDGRAGVEFGVTGVPETFLVDRKGVIVAKHTGPMQPADAQDLLEKAR